ncbi:P-loop containing nucleoside triphosphate hydrolase protein [Fomitopsis serialis]|uniref:P-loop containing nucleoside triphosphate hydrolase protein n=1 Tax=Fomitopsis serialis TaxID=139415 RepID=UPI0020076635|nr:P-loop containing nucleoside triphosphate hydrolase protein [Neoantrodia serialis]KAH9911994.1 P-loop containing nucleoside triphosphate hydrolase protein [Neoantrodia serialis]
MSISVVLGAQWGDEGKGKLVDILAADADICARCAGGNNAGHTIFVPMGAEKASTHFAFHLLSSEQPPEGLVNPNCTGVIGFGVVVHLPSFFEELDALRLKVIGLHWTVIVSDRAHLVFDFHKIVNELKEVELGGMSIGITKRASASRSGLRFRKVVGGRFKRYGHFMYDTEGAIVRYKALAERLRPYVIDGVTYIHCTYPYVTSSATAVGGVCTGLGIPPKKMGTVIGVMKAYTTRVRGGLFPTEQLNDIDVHLQEVGREFGVTTGRRRRCGWLDLVVMKHSYLINGYDSLNLTKLDILDDLEEIKVAVKYVVDRKELEGFPGNSAPRTSHTRGCNSAKDLCRACSRQGTTGVGGVPRDLQTPEPELGSSWPGSGPLCRSTLGSSTPK